MSAALAPVVAAAQVYVQQQAVLHSDKTSYSQGNQDGLNPDERQGWLWGLITPAVSVFAVVLSRAQTSAKALIGKAFSGIVISDRYGGYHWLDNEQRQLCWAHLKRDFTAMVERRGVSKEIGDALLGRERRYVEPTNNAAEWALRPAVIWRRLSFGSQSQAGSEFVVRMLSVLTSL
jgi:transposase